MGWTPPLPASSPNLGSQVPPVVSCFLCPCRAHHSPLTHHRTPRSGQRLAGSSGGRAAGAGGEGDTPLCSVEPQSWLDAPGTACSPPGREGLGVCAAAAGTGHERMVPGPACSPPQPRPCGCVRTVQEPPGERGGERCTSVWVQARRPEIPAKRFP